MLRCCKTDKEQTWSVSLDIQDMEANSSFLKYIILIE